MSCGHSHFVKVFDQLIGLQIVVKAVQQEDFRARLAKLGADPIAETPEYFHKMLLEEIARWAKVVKASGAKAE
jgi:tripartite-type tricarboxylate transporter receptor subunit TctC